MSIARRNRRIQDRQAQVHLSVLAEELMGCYKFLENKDKPSDEQIRAEFMARENRWKRYCSKNKLTEEASLLFNKEVAQSWEKRYTKQSQTQN